MDYFYNKLNKKFSGSQTHNIVFSYFIQKQIKDVNWDFRWENLLSISVAKICEHKDYIL